MEIQEQFQYKWKQNGGGGGMESQKEKKKPSVREQPKNPESTQGDIACFSVLLMDCILLKIWITE